MTNETFKLLQKIQQLEEKLKAAREKSAKVATQIEREKSKTS